MFSNVHFANGLGACTWGMLRLTSYATPSDPCMSPYIKIVFPVFPDLLCYTRTHLLNPHPPPPLPCASSIQF